MVSIIFTDDEIPVVKAYFDGTPRDDVAKSCGKSNGGVSNIWSKLENVAGPKIGELRDLKKALDKDNASLQNALEGAEIWALCQKLGVKGLAELKEFLVGVYQRSVGTGEQPNDIADMALRLKKLELKAGRMRRKFSSRSTRRSRSGKTSSCKTPASAPRRRFSKMRRRPRSRTAT